MIYLKLNDGRHILILEPGNIQEITSGGNPAASPDKEVVVCYTPDAEWLEKKISERLKELQQSPELLADLIVESQKRPPVESRPYHQTRLIKGDVN